MSSPSQIRRVEGGAWGKSQRFFDPSLKNESPGPGAPYNLPTLLNEHTPSPLYKATFESTKPPGEAEQDMPHPSRDRTAWMIGITKNDLAYYSHIATRMGPAFYQPTDKLTTPASPRAPFEKNKRFMSLTHRYISKEHNNVNLCTASPGPKYSPRTSHIDTLTPRPPEYSFGGKGSVSDRSSFVHGKVQKGYIYKARPATSDPHTNVSPANYEVKTHIIDPSAPRPVWTKADRFKDMDRLYISRKHVRSKLGMNSPGPMYNPPNYTIGSARAHKPAIVPPGKWCP